MARILLNSYYFPPIGGGGTQRPLKLARHLQDRGHAVVVLTGSGRTGELWTPADPTLEREIPESMTVLRVSGPEPQPPGRIRGRFERMARLDTSWERWWKEGTLAAGSTARDIDVVYTIMSPFSSAEASLGLSRTLGVGWVADLGDPWALDEMMFYPTSFHRHLEIRRMHRFLRTASAVVMSTPEAARVVVESFPELEDRPVVAIPNGYDPADFADTPVAPRATEKFRIVHTGYLHTELGQQQRDLSRRLLGGGMLGVDVLTRSHVYLLRAVDRLLERDPGLQERMELHFAGVLSEADKQLASQSPVSVLHGYVSHAEAIALMRSADLLFLPLQKLPPGRRSCTVPGKTYEYLASGRPILGAVPPGDARDILEASGRAFLCDPDDVDGIAAAITSVMARGAADYPADDGFASRFSYQNLAAEVASVIDAVARPGCSSPLDALGPRRRDSALS